jgi:hypothetical protein
MTKVSEALITVDGVKYRKVDREPKVGDFVLVTDDELSYLTKGKLYEVIKLDEDGDAVYLDDKGLNEYFGGSEQLLEKVVDLASEIEATRAKLRNWRSNWRRRIGLR